MRFKKKELNKLKTSLAIFLVSCICFSFPTTTVAAIKWLPVIATSPETGFQYGALLLQTLEEEAVEGKQSSIQYVAINSTESQQRLVVRPTLYFLDYKLKLTPVINYSSFPEKFYGIGNDTLESSEEDFVSDYLYLKMVARYNLISNLHLKGIVSRDDREITEFEPTRQIDTLLSSPAHIPDYTLSSSGLGLVWDTRDKPRYPDSGYYLEYTREQFEGDIYDYDEDRIDLRAFFSVGEKQVLAMQALQTKQDGQIPFINLSTIGGTDVVRGIFEGRYRAPEMQAAQVEYRKYGYEFMGLETGFTVFAASGKVLKAFPNDDDQLHTAAGIGGHFFFNPEDRTTIRLDLAYGDGETGIYLMIDQAF